MERPSLSYCSPIYNDHGNIATVLTGAILARRWTSEEVGNAIRATLTTESQLCADLADSIIQDSSTAYPPSPHALFNMLWDNELFLEICEAFQTRPVDLPIPLDPPHFNPITELGDLDIPRLATAGDLANWLDVDLNHLDWFADRYRTAANTGIPVLQHYRYSFVTKSHGPPRVIEAPKPKLMTLQKRILRQILNKIPTHDAAHGFVRGRSAHTSAQVHGGEQVVIACDLKDFFLTTPIDRVHATFRSLGYPWQVARLLVGLCTASMPRSVFRRLPHDQRHDRPTQQMFAAPHLPAGAPTSPALANLAAFGLDTRLDGLARTFGANYTRYADDLTFSGDTTLARRVTRFLGIVAEITADEGYAINQRKTRVMPQTTRQQVTGIVVNSHNNVSRTEYDRLKAVLHNCARNGPVAENRDNHSDFRAHLNGRVTWAENINPQRARKLRTLYDKIAWD
ncbi:MAG: RNA-directed DNA polymerase [Hyphomicrobiaceae bacterium]